MQTDPGKCDHIEIIFDTYSDMCDALGISAGVRQAGVYREHKKSKQVMGLQIAGVICFGEGQGSARPKFRDVRT